MCICRLDAVLALALLSFKGLLFSFARRLCEEEREPHLPPSFQG